MSLKSRQHIKTTSESKRILKDKMNLGDVLCDDNAYLEKIEKEGISMIKSMLQNLYFIWDDVGVDFKQKKIRIDIVWEHLINLLQKFIDEESGLYEYVQKTIDVGIKKIQEFRKILCMPEESEEEQSGTLVGWSDILAQKLDSLLKIKQNRMKMYQDFRTVEQKYCKILGMPTFNISSNTGVPTENDLCELEKYVNMLKDERKKRLEKFYKIKKELTTIYEETELPPETLFEENVLSIEEEDRIALSNETFKDLENTMIRLQSKKVNLENEKSSLMDKLTILWDRLNIPQDERQVCLSEHLDCRISTINSLKAEVERYREIKRQNIKMYINSLKQELLDLWNKCLVSETERQVFESLNSDEFNDEMLKVYEAEVERLRKYYRSTVHIINKIRKRQELWDLMISFENKSNDPNRFKNRKGNLLQEEKERKKLQKELPALENEIFLDIENFETATGNLFLYHGVDFQMFVRRQWEKRINQKEQDKLARQNNWTKQTENEATLGTSPSKRLACSTPSSTPNKHFKPAVRFPVYRTPNLKNIITPNKVARSQPKSMKKKNERKISEENTVDRTSESNSFDDTSYTEFAGKLNRSSRVIHRSSVLSSRKTTGTRILQNNHTSRKKGNKSLRKSCKKKTHLSKTTPVRGKLGLPILM